MPTPELFVRQDGKTWKVIDGEGAVHGRFVFRSDAYGFVASVGYEECDCGYALCHECAEKRAEFMGEI